MRPENMKIFLRIEHARARQSPCVIFSVSTFCLLFAWWCHRLTADLASSIRSSLELFGCISFWLPSDERWNDESNEKFKTIIVVRHKVSLGFFFSKKTKETMKTLTNLMNCAPRQPIYFMCWLGKSSRRWKQKTETAWKILETLCFGFLVAFEGTQKIAIYLR